MKLYNKPSMSCNNEQDINYIFQEVRQQTLEFMYLRATHCHYC